VAVGGTILIRLIQLCFLTVLGGASMAHLVRKINRSPAKIPAGSGVAKSF